VRFLPGADRAVAELAAGIDLRAPEYTLWWGVIGLLLPTGFAVLLFVLVRAVAGGGRARLPVDSRGAVTLVGHLLRADAALTPDRWRAPSCHGVLVIVRGGLRWHYDRRDGWAAPAPALTVQRVTGGTQGPLSAGVEFEIAGSNEWAGRWRLVLGPVEPQGAARSWRARARRRAEKALAHQLAAALIAQGAVDGRR